MSTCYFCLKSDSRYSCPRCNHPYCGVSCYQSPGHSQCSESFYKDCVQTELAHCDLTENISVREKTREILEKAKTAAETEDNLDLDSDDDEDLSDRIANIDLEDSDQLWAVLTPQERKDFKDKLNSGELYKLVPPNERNEQGVWWEICLPKRKIKEVSHQDIAEVPDHQLHVCLPILKEPSVLINTKDSSPLIKCNLINVLYAYVVTYRHVSWHTTVSREKNISSEEVHEFLTSVLTVSSNLSKDENFATAEMAIVSGATKANEIPNLNPDLVRLARADVASIVKGPGGGDELNDLLYVLAALSDLKSLATQVRENYVKNENFSRKRCGLVSKKIDFFLCWVQQQHVLPF